ncbi:MAG: PD-(D/E)XK nuclease family protein [Flavobacterium sp.]
MKNLFSKLSEVKIFYNKKREEYRFNIVTALHKERDEVYLHSRIISYLISPDSGHGMKYRYLELFVREVLKFNNEKFDLSNVLVLPNEKNKSEYKEIDILIINKVKGQAIIIENKIDAKDSNNEIKKNGYQGQLERYYNTIKSGIDKDGKESKEFKCNQVFVFYLSINKRPSEKSIGILKDETNSWSENSLLNYDPHIRDWLVECLKVTPEDKQELKIFIKHYSRIIDKLTHNDIPMDERLKLKSIIAENIEETKYLIDNFKHVKWHTIHEFWSELKNELEKEFTEVNFYSEDGLNLNKTVDIVVNKSKELNYGYTFKIDNKLAYISGLGKISWGLVSPKKWIDIKEENIENINFYDFSSDATFLLIDRLNMFNAIKKIIEEINDSRRNNFLNH